MAKIPNESENGAPESEAKRMLRKLRSTDSETQGAVQKLLECTPRKRVALNSEIEERTRTKSFEKTIQEMVTE